MNDKRTGNFLRERVSANAYSYTYYMYYVCMYVCIFLYFHVNTAGAVGAVERGAVGICHHKRQLGAVCIPLGKAFKCSYCLSVCVVIWRLLLVLWEFRFA